MDHAAAEALQRARVAAELAVWAATGVRLSVRPDLLWRSAAEREAHRAEVARLARESELQQAALDRYMQGRDASDAATSKEWVLTLDPLSQDLIARRCGQGRKMET